MALYKFADLIIALDNKYDYLPKQCAEYEHIADASADLTVCVPQEQIIRERDLMPVPCSDGYLESVCAYRTLCQQLPVYDAFLLHGSVIDFGGRGIVFSANSGVGKTTHTMLWQQVYGKRMRIINGDKPIVRFLEGVPYAYGTPWAGKEKFQCNDRVRLTDLCFIERSTENQVFQIKPEECIHVVMQQVLIPSDPRMAVQTLQLLDRLLSFCRLWVIRCNISEDAAILAHDTILGVENHET